MVPSGTGAQHPQTGGRGPESPVVHTLRVVGAVTRPRGAAPRGARLPGGGEVPQAGPGASAVGRWSLLGPPQVSTCGVGSRPIPGGGSRLSLEKARTQRVAGGYPPPPVFLWPARCSLARFGVGSAAERWKGYYGAHARALIWIRILREQGLGAKAFCCRGIPPAKASPWGEAVTGGDG